MQIFTVVIRARHDIRLGSDKSTGDWGWPTTALEVHMPWITRRSWFPEVALGRSHPATERTRPRGRKLRPLTATTTRRHGLRRPENDRAGASASHRFDRADSLRDSMYVSCLTSSSPRARTCAFAAPLSRS